MAECELCLADDGDHTQDCPMDNGCTCTCSPLFGPYVEHQVQCGLYEPPLTQAEIRELRRLLAFSRPVLG